MNELPHEISKVLAKKVLDDFYKPLNDYKITVFLCGASLDKKQGLRYKINEELKNNLLFDVILPEDLFEELLYSSNLLSLELMLANSVDVIIIAPESPGSFSELGAFANDERLLKKLICVVNSKFKKDRNFIYQGPIKQIRKRNKDNIIYIDGDVDRSLISKISKPAKKIKGSMNKTNNKLNLLQIQNFLLPLIYLLGPVTKNDLINLVRHASEYDKQASHATTATLTLLTKKRMIEQKVSGYELTVLGISEFFDFKQRRRSVSYKFPKLNELKFDDLILEFYNYKYRSKKIRL